MNEENKAKKKKIIVIAVIALILIIGLIVFLWWRSKITATTMRILRMEGTVTLEDDGKEKTITSNLRLNSGNALATAIKSLVSIGLDDTKIVTLDQSSRAEFNQSGRKLELDLTDGSLFFEVQKPLEDDESFDISTSTMVVGIRGTSGWVSVEGGNESLIVTDGHVHVIGTNPVTGEVKEIDVKAGQRITVYLYNDRKVDSIMFELEDITEHDLPEFLLERLRENPELLEKVCRETGWDKPWILGIKEEELPKTIVKSNDKDDDNGSSDALTETDTELPNTGEEESEEKKTEKDGPLTKEQLAWAHSHIAVTDPATGIMALKDMTLFDPAFYAATNPDVVAEYGTDPDALLWHYLQKGKKEGRPPIAPPTPTPTPTPWWLYSQEKSEKTEEEDNSNNGGGKNVVGAEYTFTGNNGVISYPNAPELHFTGNGANGTLEVDPQSQDGAYIDLPVTINWTDNGNNYSKTFNHVDEIQMNSSASLTGGGITKTSRGEYLELSTGKITLTDPSWSPDIAYGYSAIPVVSDGNGNSYAHSYGSLGKIDWKASADNVSVSNTPDPNFNPPTYTVTKNSDTSYTIDDGTNTYSYTDPDPDAAVQKLQNGISSFGI